MRALSLSGDPQQKDVFSKKTKSLLDEAERIKHGGHWSTVRVDASHTERSALSSGVSGNEIKPLKEPENTRSIAKAEQILIYSGSKLHGYIFPPWLGPPSHDEFEITDGAMFTDKPDLTLSETQRAVFDGWRRPKEALPPPSWLSDGKEAVATMQAHRMVDLVQDAATDCSVVASLCAVTARAERGYTKLAFSILYPHDGDIDCPQVSRNGKYVVRLNFNGCYRKVVVDDRLPVSRTSRVLHVLDRQNPGLLWPALLEKAYLKVRGGYDFPGSNSGTDLWVLTGWVPEQVFLQSDDLVTGQLWRRLYRAFLYGDVLITIGTGKMRQRLERQLGLVGLHDYAILDITEEEGQRLMLVKNPWCEGISWTGSPASARSPLGEGNDDGQLGTRNSAPANLPISSSNGGVRQTLNLGTFWMDFDNVTKHFESIYLNWNPGLFTHRQDIHFRWDLSGAQHDPLISPAGSVRSHPQFAVANQGARAATVWLLLWKHFSSHRSQTLDTVRDSEVSCPDHASSTGYISLYTFQNHGQRVYLADGALERCPYVDSPQTLLRLEIPGETVYTVIPSQQDLPAMNHVFTLSAFSTSSIQVTHAQDKYSEHSVTNSAWQPDTAGGNGYSPTYANNPQFSLTLQRSSAVALVLETGAENVNVHVQLLHGRGQRMYTITTRDVVVDSGDYRRGCALAELAHLDAGTYTVICSTFKTGQLGTFSLRVDSVYPARLSPIRREGSGRLRTPVPPAEFRSGISRLGLRVKPHRLSRVAFTAKPDPSRQRRSPLHLSVELVQGPLDRHGLAASGDGKFSDAASGVRTGDVDLSPELLRRGEVWLLIERLGNGVGGMGGHSVSPEEIVEVECWKEGLETIEFGPWISLEDR